MLYVMQVTNEYVRIGDSCPNFVCMKQKYKYLAFLITTLLVQTPSAHAQFNTIQEYGNQRTKKVQERIHKKNCQPTTDSVKVDSLYRNPATKNESGIFGNKLMALPLKKIHVTSSFGRRTHPISKKRSMHNGVDLRASFEDVYSMLPGIVHKVGEDKRSGKFIIVSTGNYMISYCHLSRFNVEAGDVVMAGTTIAVSGNSGLSTGAHLHLTIRKSGKLLNPKIVLAAISNHK